MRGYHHYLVVVRDVLRAIWIALLTLLVEIADIRSSTVSVDLVRLAKEVARRRMEYLMDSHCHDGSGLDLSDHARCQLILGFRPNVDVTSQLSSPTLIHDIGCDFGVTNNGGVLLTRTNSSAVPRDSIIHCPMLTTSFA